MSSACYSSSSNDSVIPIYHLWHEKLKHPSFNTTLKTLKCNNVDISSVHNHLCFVTLVNLLRHISYISWLIMKSLNLSLYYCILICGIFLDCQITFKDFFCLLLIILVCLYVFSTNY